MFVGESMSQVFVFGGECRGIGIDLESYVLSEPRILRLVQSMNEKSGPIFLVPHPSFFNEWSIRFLIRSLACFLIPKLILEFILEKI